MEVKTRINIFHNGNSLLEERKVSDSYIMSVMICNINRCKGYTTERMAYVVFERKKNAFRS